MRLSSESSSTHCKTTTACIQRRHVLLGLLTSGPIMKAQAEKLNKVINGDDTEFSASQGWLWRWQRRHGISQAKVMGKKRSADADGTASFPAKLVKVMEDNSLCA